MKKFLFLMFLFLNLPELLLMKQGKYNVNKMPKNDVNAFKTLKSHFYNVFNQTQSAAAHIVSDKKVILSRSKKHLKSRSLLNMKTKPTNEKLPIPSKSNHSLKKEDQSSQKRNLKNFNFPESKNPLTAKKTLSEKNIPSIKAVPKKEKALKLKAPKQKALMLKASKALKLKNPEQKALKLEGPKKKAQLKKINDSKKIANKKQERRLNLLTESVVQNPQESQKALIPTKSKDHISKRDLGIVENIHQVLKDINNLNTKQNSKTHVYSQKNIIESKNEDTIKKIKRSTVTNSFKIEEPNGLDNVTNSILKIEGTTNRIFTKNQKINKENYQEAVNYEKITHVDKNPENNFREVVIRRIGDEDSNTFNLDNDIQEWKNQIATVDENFQPNQVAQNVQNLIVKNDSATTPVQSNQDSSKQKKIFINMSKVVPDDESEDNDDNLSTEENNEKIKIDLSDLKDSNDDVNDNNIKKRKKIITTSVHHVNHFQVYPSYQQNMLNPMAMNNSMMNPISINNTMMYPMAMNSNMMNPISINNSMMNPMAMNNSMMNPISINNTMMNPMAMNNGMMNPMAMNNGMMNPMAMNYSMTNPMAMNDSMMNPMAMNDSLINPLGLDDSMINPNSFVENNRNEAEQNYDNYNDGSDYNYENDILNKNIVFQPDQTFEAQNLNNNLVNTNQDLSNTNNPAFKPQTNKSDLPNDLDLEENELLQTQKNLKALVDEVRYPKSVIATNAKEIEHVQLENNNVERDENNKEFNDLKTSENNKLDNNIKNSEDKLVKVENELESLKNLKENHNKIDQMEKNPEELDEQIKLVEEEREQQHEEEQQQNKEEQHEKKHHEEEQHEEEQQHEKENQHEKEQQHEVKQQQQEKHEEEQNEEEQNEEEEEQNEKSRENSIEESEIEETGKEGEERKLYMMINKTKRYPVKRSLKKKKNQKIYDNRNTVNSLYRKKNISKMLSNYHPEKLDYSKKAVVSNPNEKLLYSNFKKSFNNQQFVQHVRKNENVHVKTYGTQSTPLFTENNDLLKNNQNVHTKYLHTVYKNLHIVHPRVSKAVEKRNYIKHEKHLLMERKHHIEHLLHKRGSKNSNRKLLVDNKKEESVHEEFDNSIKEFESLIKKSIHDTLYLKAAKNYLKKY